MEAGSGDWIEALRNSGDNFERNDPGPPYNQLWTRLGLMLGLSGAGSTRGDIPKSEKPSRVTLLTLSRGCRLPSGFSCDAH